MQKPKWKKLLKEWIMPFGIAIIVSLAIRTYGFAHVEVFSISMENTLVEGHRLIEDKISYRFSKPERGDIVVVNGPEYPKRLIKRVIGLPGETVDFLEGRVLINGHPLEEEYTVGLTNARSIAAPIVVPDNAYFLMGDNREHSVDSRMLGAIPFSSIEGKALVRFWPISEAGMLD